MRKVIAVFLAFSVFLAGCSTKKVEAVEKKSSYSLLDEIYSKPDEKVKELVRNMKEVRKEVLKSPKYIKIYRGSYRDEQGNVVLGGMEYLLIDDGTPDTDF